MKNDIVYLVLCLMIAVGMTSCGGSGENNSQNNGSGVDTTAPTVISISPVNNSTNVSIGTEITAVFSETMLASSITATTFSVVGVSGTVSYNGLTATFTPSGPLAYSTTY